MSCGYCKDTGPGQSGWLAADSSGRFPMTVEARLEKAKADRLREINAALLEALEAQGNVRDDGNWHSKGCHPFRDNPYPCSSWCIQAREAIEEARK